ncbi:winged helix-turn-helix transcriptional regulator [Variovorax guangxiensis]|uniref:winged helix-turn-helix transcriptional regulator n=1 Tax=Variovorax guangxiensis TaxID=1775474 RepID=UPI00286AA842|nr:winged helix-turn-helix transcriptional regulator [Variovorax guangxiensis]
MHGWSLQRQNLRAYFGIGGATSDIRVVSRTVFAEVPPRVEYAITPKARGLGPTMEALTAWWQKYGGTIAKRPGSRGRKANA